MADIVCPKCNNLNPEDTRECLFCGSPLIPPSGESIHPGSEPVKKVTSELERVSTPTGKTPIRPGELPTKKDTGELEKALPTWLQNLRKGEDKASGESEPKPEQPAGSEGEPPAAEKGELPDWLAGLKPAEDEEEIPDWLAGLRKQPESPSTAGAETPASQPGPEKEPEAKEPVEGEAIPAEVPDWLANLKPETAAPVEEAGKPANDTPDWLANLKGQEAAPAADEGIGKPEEETPDWLAALKSEAAAPADGEGTEKPEDETPDWLAKLDQAIPANDTPPASGGSEPEWLAGMAAGAVQPESTPPANEAEKPDWLSNLEDKQPAGESEGVQGAQPAETPDWLSSLEDKQPAGESEGVQEAQPAETPDWLSSLETKQPAGESEETAPEGTPEWLSEIPREGTTSEKEPATPTEPGEMPDWLRQIEAEAGPKETPAAKPFNTDALKTPEGEVPDWLSNLPAGEANEETPVPGETGKASEAEGLPDWLNNIKAEDSGAGSAALVQSGAPGEAQSQGAGMFSMEEQPDWLSTLKPEEGEKSQPPEAGENEAETPDSLEKADLPSWVQAMRPVEAVVADINNEPVEPTNQPTEQSGPLAGLRGVLPAVPGLGPLRKPPAYSIKLQVGEGQQQHADRLEKIITNEAEPVTTKGRARLHSARVLRWVIAAILFLVIGGTIISGAQIVPAGGLYPPEMTAAMNVIGGLGPNAPVLVVFDYQPAFSGELEAAAGPVIDDLLFRGVRLTLVSTSPTGPVLGEGFLRTAQAEHQYQAGQQYVDLGYLPGGPAGVLGFAQNPKNAVPYDVNGQDAWQLPPLQGVTHFSDFAAVIILTDDADTGRIWIEQAGALAGGKPMLMVISAQAEPMIRPYYDSGQLQGLVTGLAGGKAYEEIINRPGAAGAYWNAFSVGMLSAEIMIGIGALWSLITAWRGRRNETQESEAE